MAPGSVLCRSRRSPAPRARGDGPGSTADVTVAFQGHYCSPRTRGWPHTPDPLVSAIALLPAHAGMEPRRSGRGRWPASAPRAQAGMCPRRRNGSAPPSVIPALCDSGSRWGRVPGGGRARDRWSRPPGQPVSRTPRHRRRRPPALPRAQEVVCRLGQPLGMGEHSGVSGDAAEDGRVLVVDHPVQSAVIPASSTWWRSPGWTRALQGAGQLSKRAARPSRTIPKCRSNRWSPWSRR